MLKTAARNGTSHLTATVPGFSDLPAAQDMGSVLRAIRAVVERHDNLRVRFYTSQAGEMRQAVQQCGSIDVPVFEASGSPSVTTDAVATWLRQQPFTLGELPFRVALITQDGALSRVVMCFLHLAADTASAVIVCAQIARLTADPGAVIADSWQTSDIIRYEDSSQGKRRAQRSADYWRSQLQHAPNTVFPIRPVSDRTADYEVGITSRAAAAAGWVLRQRYEMGMPNVALAAMALLVSTVSGRERCTINMAWTNRGNAHMRESVGNFFQIIPVSLQVNGTFGQLLRQAATNCMWAYQRGHYDPAVIDELRFEVARERGVRPALSCAINFASGPATQRHGESDDAMGIDMYGGMQPEAIRRLTAETETYLVEDGLPRTLRISLRLSIWYFAETAIMTLAGDPRLFSRADRQAMLKAIEVLLVEAASGADSEMSCADLARLAQLSPAASSRTGLMSLDNCWVDLAAVRELVCQATGCRDADVFAVRSGDERSRLEAFMSGCPGMTPEMAHSACVAALTGKRFVMTPHYYVICAESPGQPRDLVAWRSVTALREGTGRVCQVRHSQPGHAERTT